MAAPVGHIVCALALLNSGTVNIVDRDAFLVGTNFPDIRYISDVRRSTTHRTDGEGLKGVVNAETPFEAGRRFHVFVDREREKYMRDHDAYRFVKNGPLKTQMLKIIEDHIMFEKLKDKFDAKKTFRRIHDEERSYSVSEKELETWHQMLTMYLDQSYWFNVFRYYRSLMAFQEAYGLPSELFGNFWQGLKTLGFFIYAYIQVEILSRNQELRAIILDFYENKMEEIIRLHQQEEQEQTAHRYSPNPSRLSVLLKPDLKVASD
ncbi:MAG TPA: hypothetical protein VEL47_03290 [Myxococcota bacterium]|nr:hypothetical protein [Myxococcota bacterium]